MFSLFKRISISYGITVCNEAKEIELLLSTLIPIIDKRDEIIVLQDVTHRNESVSAVLNNHRKNINIIETKLNGDFATFKNNFFKLAKGDFLFQIDADEVPQATLIKKIKPVLKKNKKSDCFLVPRVNVVNGYTDAHVKRWNWNINDKNYINFPDYQPRIVKLKAGIKWINKVHEVFTGYQCITELPSDDETFCLIHIKDIRRQEKQNSFYENLS
ncbi:glycosyltransferase [Pedobacter sp. MC2016-14]|uniref:glycosyltransferase n=1 Tax=Pedobacter sp. MC2016-14 TaxID=2897327 RepID=UPI001E53B546|nr:glycosyltransferase [Pedobacter sp. MC2016-14]MCD0487104.1 glycosyltransferase [Pedobacter sp. MC2016-14]